MLRSLSGPGAGWLAIPIGLVATICAGPSCSDQKKPGPAITAVEPNVVSSRRETAAVLRGRNFFTTVYSSLDDDEPPRIESSWTATIAEQELLAAALTLRNSERFDLQIPAGLPLGSHPLIITSRVGISARLDNALIVVDDRACLTWYEDLDGDGFGNPNQSRDECIQPAGYVANDLDCADQPVSDPACGGRPGSECNPNAAEGPEGDVTCGDQVDNNCDGKIDNFDSVCCPVACSACGNGCCLDRCGGGDCGLSCDGSTCPCNLDCDGTSATCTTSCSSPGRCDVNCQASNTCQATCRNTTCTYDCTGTNDCRVTCQNNAVCDINCTDGNDCNAMVCATGAQCRIDCTRATTCAFQSCDGAQASCADNSIVCNRPCPP